ncbi:MAG: sigma-70 family RNA polymerase sigma factor [Planctomycetota bacterium]
MLQAVPDHTSRPPSPPEPPPGPAATDAELLHAAAHGQADAAREFVRRYQRRLLSYLNARLADRHRAEDVAQETFLRLFRAGQTSSAHAGRASVATWLFTIARNCMTDHLRAALRRPLTLHVDLPPGQPPPEPRPHAADRPDVRAADAEDRAQMLYRLAELPPPLREAVELRILAGLTFREVAELTGEPASTIKNRTARALARLADASADPADNPKPRSGS